MQTQQTTAPTTELASPVVIRATQASPHSLAAGPEQYPQAAASAAMPSWKRALDVFGATAGLVVLSPLFLGVAVLIKVFSRGPVFFRQKRAGLGGEPFVMWKFRTLKPRADAGVHRSYVAELARSGGEKLQKLDNRGELIPFGGVLRKCGIDELPQLINVLRGEMSLVGPRPDVIDYDDYLPWQQRRFDVSPGITGLWQVTGKNTTTFDEMIQLDIEYIERRSLGLDLWILLVTVPAMVGQVGQKS